MTENKPIIVDGVDVAGCEFAVKPINDNKIKCHCAKGLLQLAKMHEQPESIKSGLCENNSNCYFKQLARKTQECEELTKNYIMVIQQRNIAQQQLDQLKAENENLKNEIEACYNQVEDFDIIATSKSNKLKQAEQKLKRIKEVCKNYCEQMCLCESKEVCEDCINAEVLQIIDEVKNE